MRDPIIERIEALCDAENERRADEYWDIEEKLAEKEEDERFDEATGGWR